MGFVESIVTQFTDLTAGIAESRFGEAAALLGATGQLVATLVVILTIINMGLQRVYMPLEVAVPLIFRIVLVALFLGSWTQFATVAYAIQNGFDAMAGVMFAGTGYEDAQSIGEAIDDLLRSTGSVSSEAVGRLDIMGAVMNGVFWLLIAIAGAIAAFSIVIANAALTIIFTLAPLAILATLWEGTRDYFQKWLSAAITFMLFPVILAGTLGLILQLGSSVLQPPDAGLNTLGQTFPYGMFVVLSILMLLATPLLVTMMTGQLQMNGLARAVGGAALLGAAARGGGALASMGGRAAGTRFINHLNAGTTRGSTEGASAPTPSQLQGTAIERSRRNAEASMAAREREKARLRGQNS